MGSLHYDGAVVEIDDRMLVHLQIVMVQKFRKNESFLMSWLHLEALHGARGSLWLTPGTPVYFRFFGSRVPAIDDGWLQRLAASAASSTGMVLTGEDGRPVRLPAVRANRPNPVGLSR